MIDWPTTLHWLRPHWLWALLALPLLWAGWNARRKRESVWREVIDPHLLPHLLERSSPVARGFGLWAMIAYALAVLAMAGPSWRQVEQPLWQTRAPLVIALDLSSATLAADLPPTRLLQARAKIAALLRERSGGQVGLVAFAADAFTVAPLTDDAANLALFLDALAPDVMPMDGSRGDRAIDVSVQLLKQAGFDRGDILLLTDHADGDAIAAAQRASRAGYRVSALGLGSTTGAAYRTAGGTIAQTRLDEASLRAMARAAGGSYATATTGDGDLRALGVLEPPQAGGAASRGEKGYHWQDGGYWLLPPLLLLALFAFRRGGASATAALLLCVALPMSPVRAADGDLWRRADQQAHQQLLQGVEAYRKQDFAAAEKAWQGIDSADGHYNHGNALAKAGRYPEAIAAYDRALKAQPGMDDAIANKRAVEAAMKRKPPPGGKQEKKNKDSKQDSKPDKNQGEQSQPSSPSSGDGDASQQQPPPTPPDPAKQEKQGQSGAETRPQDNAEQEAADAAQRERMQRAMEQPRQEKAEGEPQPAQARVETPAERERRQANEAWLRRVPDDPGGLLRAKFRLEQERRQQSGSSP
ncbi:Ca-activated chloride channel family protein [Luteimonas cucumeris]|uniref:Ca-activated chloride channel family protein n=1 Tax=Luteimonas cucumeris TaxID=985012 RepID=A0A562LF23_9GAMM|nr:VWA domain-containing protein [Luteimonas cucumeris]TWI06213.1 Ca-activated chloride channel family protein [Luteimonas cucumeris]